MIPAIPQYLMQAGYRTRAEADALGILGPTLDDIKHFIHQCGTHFVEFPMANPEIRPLGSSPAPIIGHPASYRLGTLTGRWQGSYIVRHDFAYPGIRV